MVAGRGCGHHIILLIIGYSGSMAASSDIAAIPKALAE
jgi:hypothetical protein